MFYVSNWLPNRISFSLYLLMGTLYPKETTSLE